MSGKKLAAKTRPSLVDSVYHHADLKAEELCRRREVAFPVRLTGKQFQALDALMAKRDLFL